MFLRCLYRLLSPKPILCWYRLLVWYGVCYGEEAKEAVFPEGGVWGEGVRGVWVDVAEGDVFEGCEDEDGFAGVL